MGIGEASLMMLHGDSAVQRLAVSIADLSVYEQHLLMDLGESALADQTIDVYLTQDPSVTDVTRGARKDVGITDIREPLLEGDGMPWKLAISDR